MTCKIIDEFVTEFINRNTLEKVTVYQTNLPKNKTIYTLRKYDKYKNLMETCERNTREEYRQQARKMLNAQKFKESY